MKWIATWSHWESRVWTKTILSCLSDGQRSGGENKYSFEEINKFINTIDPKYRIAYEYDTNLGKVIDFGQKASYSIGCDMEDVLEVIIKIGDKEFKYESQKFEIGVIF